MRPDALLSDSDSHSAEVSLGSETARNSVPVAKPVKLLGYLSADMHRPQKDDSGTLFPRDSARDHHIDPKIAAFQRFAMDIISDLLEPFMVVPAPQLPPE